MRTESEKVFGRKFVERGKGVFEAEGETES